MDSRIRGENITHPTDVASLFDAQNQFNQENLAGGQELLAFRHRDGLASVGFADEHVRAIRADSTGSTGSLVWDPGFPGTAVSPLARVRAQQ